MSTTGRPVAAAYTYQAARRARSQARIDGARSRMDAGLLNPARVATAGHRAIQTASHAAIHRAAGLAKPRRKKLPRQAHPRNIERDYGKAIKALVIPVLRAAIAPLLAELPQLLDAAAREREQHYDRADADGFSPDQVGHLVELARARGRVGFAHERVTELVDLARAHVRSRVTTGAGSALADRFGQQVSDFNRTQLARQVRAAIGVDPLMSEAPLRPILAAYSHANVSQIMDLPETSLDQIEALTQMALRHGRRHEDVAEDIEGRVGIASGRAQFIARNEIGSLNGQVNAARQRSLGITRFVWRSVEDERVRPEHADYDGNTYEYDDPPEGLLPGEDYGCRCSAEPDTSDIEALLDDDEPSSAADDGED